MRTSHSGRGIGPFHDCQRCGFTFRASDLRRQLGLLVCWDCYDDPIAWTRQNIIQDVLNFTSEEELRVADVLKENQNDDIEGF